MRKEGGRTGGRWEGCEVRTDRALLLVDGTHALCGSLTGRAGRDGTQINGLPAHWSSPLVEEQREPHTSRL